MNFGFVRRPLFIKRILCMRNKLQNIYKYSSFHRSNHSHYATASFFPLSLSIFGFVFKEEESLEDKLSNTIKRAVVNINRKQYDKAEQILHLALRMAQDLQSKNGITYVYDVMANLALEREQYKKAEKLFSEVMRRLLEDGYPQDNLKVIHISLKLANIAQLQGDLDKSTLGFNWTIKKIKQRTEADPDDNEVKEIYGLAMYWFGQLLMKKEKYEEALAYLTTAYNYFTEIHGFDNDECITVLNDLSVACVKVGKLSEAQTYILTALKLAKAAGDSQQEGVLYVNLGLVQLKQGLIDEAKIGCSQAWRLGKMLKDVSTIKEAEYCLSEIKKCQT